MSDHAEGVLPPTRARLTFEEADACGTPAPVALVSIRRESLENELAAVEVALEGCVEKARHEWEAANESRFWQLTGARAVLRWLLFGIEGRDMPMSIQIAEWRNQDRITKQV